MHISQMHPNATKLRFQSTALIPIYQMNDNLVTKENEMPNQCGSEPLKVDKGEISTTKRY